MNEILFWIGIAIAIVGFEWLILSHFVISDEEADKEIYLNEL